MSTSTHDDEDALLTISDTFPDVDAATPRIPYAALAEHSPVYV